MARVTLALDAGVLIGLLDPNDAHHAVSMDVFASDTCFLVHPLNLAEALVNPERKHRGLDAFEDLRRLGVVASTLGENEALILAHVRSEHHLRMPDSCALALAIHNDVPLVTFDKRLASAASAVGLLLTPAPA